MCIAGGGYPARYCEPIQVYNHGLEVSYPPYSNALSSESTRESSNRKSDHGNMLRGEYQSGHPSGHPSWTQVNQFCLASTTSLVGLPCVPVVWGCHTMS